ncbi:MAG: LPXTG cell wall anchor domain-containing protein, partial [Clostridiales bacterium]|nr:LPXTG cell wall anchor domain-containing protein [Clostridiales bacterium]
DGYKKLANDLCFTIGADGTVTIVNDGYKNWLTVSHPEQGVVSYEIAVENAPLGVTFRKTDEKGELLTGSKFTLCALATDFDVWEAVNDHGIAGGVLDLTDSAELNITNVQNGRYRLTETVAPAGYVIRTVHIYFTVSDGALTLTDENGEACAYSLVHLEDDDTTIVVANTPGQPLPSTGGIGTHLFTALGAITLALSVILFVCEMHKRKRSGSEGQN